MEMATPAFSSAPVKAADVNCEARSGSNISGLLNVAKASSSAPHHARSALDTQSMTATR
jgi:hypothetical protein